MKNNYLYSILFLLLAVVLLSACGGDYTPKPRGYFRFDLPEKQYQKFDSVSFPYKFEYPVYARISKPDNESTAEPYWINVTIPAYNATIYLSYKAINNNLASLLETTYQMVSKHTIKADAIADHIIENEPNNVYGVMYELGGNTATALQFFVTDSVKNFLRGSLYFYAEPNKDSLAPLISFFKEDIEHMIETFEWK